MPRNMCLKTRQKKRTEDWPAWRNIAGKKVKIENLSSKSNELTPDQRDRPQNSRRLLEKPAKDEKKTYGC